MSNTQASSSLRSRINLHEPFLFSAALTITLLISTLPEIVYREILKQPPPNVLVFRLSLLAAAFGLALVWPKLRPLRDYFLIFFVLTLLETAAIWVGTTNVWIRLSNLVQQPFAQMLISSQFLRFGVTITLILFLLLLKGHPRNFFLTAGKLDAVGDPVKWVGATDPVNWKRFGPILSVCIGSGLVVFMLLAGNFQFSQLQFLLPTLPWVFVFAAMNAFSEEMSYRAPQLAALEPSLGKYAALFITAAYFGIAHYYGVPYGLVGVLMSGGLGWFLGKSMLETRGLFWAWFIHFVLDVLIFTFMAMSAITPGG